MYVEDEGRGEINKKKRERKRSVPLTSKNRSITVPGLDNKVKIYNFLKPRSDHDGTLTNRENIPRT